MNWSRSSSVASCLKADSSAGEMIQRTSSLIHFLNGPCNSFIRCRCSSLALLAASLSLCFERALSGAAVSDGEETGSDFVCCAKPEAISRQDSSIGSSHREPKYLVNTPTPEDASYCDSMCMAYAAQTGAKLAHAPAPGCLCFQSLAHTS